MSETSQLPYGGAGDSQGGDRPVEGVWPVVGAVIDEHFDQIRTRLHRTVQTVQSPSVSLADLDRSALVFARTHGHTPGLERVVAAVSRAGEHAACWVALGVAGAACSRRPDRRRAWLRGVRTVAASYGANQAVKFAVRRRRPELPGLRPLTPTVTQLSFPSAHATTSFAAARAYGPLAPASAFYAAAIALAMSRPYLGVHYPSDVIAGALLGTIVAGLLS